uniref:Fucosyltransferase n=1 Tax=Meloidogyne incognita TaxID=6306 RepID=A0A914L512_MELIC
MLMINYLEFVPVKRPSPTILMWNKMFGASLTESLLQYDNEFLSRKIFEGLNIPTDSFIAADDFESPKDLASFLEKLAADKKRYKSYFRWTKKYKKTENTNSISNPLCNLCKMAHIHKKELKIKNIYDFWNGGGKCQQGFALNILLS